MKDKLLKLQDIKYKSFQERLIPNIDKSVIIGIKIPVLRKLAKEMIKDESYIEFLDNLPHVYLEENLLHAILVSELKDYDQCIFRLNLFLPYVDNWEVCDIISPKVFKKNNIKLIDEIKEWLNSKDEYIIRFGIEILMMYYLDDNFDISYHDLVSKIRSSDYYVNMMIAWYFATALAKKWDISIKYIEDNKLDTWTHNKTIQKAIESYRITKEQKEYLRQLKI
jgi:hypothetical protein